VPEPRIHPFIELRRELEAKPHVLRVSGLPGVHSEPPVPGLLRIKLTEKLSRARVKHVAEKLGLTHTNWNGDEPHLVPDLLIEPAGERRTGAEKGWMAFVEFPRTGGTSIYLHPQLNTAELTLEHKAEINAFINSLGKRETKPSGVLPFIGKVIRGRKK